MGRLLGPTLAVLLAAALAHAVEPVAPVSTEGGLALHGHDPVAYFTEGAPTEGSVQHTYQWRGATYRFASAENRERFAAEPARYAPQYGGYCAIAMAHDSIADIDPDRWAIVDGKLYLNNNWLAQKLWSVDRSGNIVKGDRNWAAYPKLAGETEQ